MLDAAFAFLQRVVPAVLEIRICFSFLPKDRPWRDLNWLFVVLSDTTKGSSLTGLELRVCLAFDYYQRVVPGGT